MDIEDLEAALVDLRFFQRDLHWALSTASPVEALVLLPIISDGVELADRIDTLIKAIGEEK